MIPDDDKIRAFWQFFNTSIAATSIILLAGGAIGVIPDYFLLYFSVGIMSLLLILLLLRWLTS